MIETEIEKKWLITADKDTVEKVLKNYEIKRSGELRQAYIIDKPVEVRIRHMRYNDGEEYYSLDNKIGTGLVRTELGNKITKEDYDRVLEQIGKPETVKDYRRYKLGNLDLEYSDVDDFTMAYMEIEFTSEEEAHAFKLPSDIASICREVTGLTGYNMQDYWRKTRGF